MLLKSKELCVTWCRNKVKDTISTILSLVINTVNPYRCAFVCSRTGHTILSKYFCPSANVSVCSPGLLWQLRPSDVEVELLAHTRNVISKDLEEETGLHTGWIQNGGLFIASNKQRLDEYKRLMSVGNEMAWFWPLWRNYLISLTYRCRLRFIVGQNICSVIGWIVLYIMYESQILHHK